MAAYALVARLASCHRDQIACMASAPCSESAKSSDEASQGFETLAVICCVQTQSPSPGIRLRVSAVAVHDQDYRSTGKNLSFFNLFLHGRIFLSLIYSYSVQRLVDLLVFDPADVTIEVRASSIIASQMPRGVGNLDA
jgi:hypothetical protein